MLLAALILLAQADVAIFVLDDIGKADLALYGGSVATPHLDALAAQGVRFDRCYANPMCMPSRLSLLTGTWATSGTGEECSTPGPRTPPLSRAFLPEGLPGHASGIVGKWHLGADPLGGPWQIAPIRQGFDYWTAGMGGNAGACAGVNYFNWERVNASADFYVSGMLTIYEPIAVRDAFMAGWSITPSPKLAVVSWNLAHGPFHVPPPPLYTGPFPGPYRPRFEAMISAGDYLLGQALAEIDLETTLVIVVGDNGTPGQVAPDSTKAKFSSYERGVRVPLVIAGVGVVGGRVSSELVHLVDLWATAIDAGGGMAPLGSPVPLRGVSLCPILADATHPPPHEMVLVGHNWGEAVNKGNRAAINAAGMKLIQWDDNNDGIADREELYDLTTDPLEAFPMPLGVDADALRLFIEAEAP